MGPVPRFPSTPEHKLSFMRNQDKLSSIQTKKSRGTSVYRKTTVRTAAVVVVLPSDPGFPLTRARNLSLVRNQILLSSDRPQTQHRCPDSASLSPGNGHPLSSPGPPDTARRPDPDLTAKKNGLGMPRMFRGSVLDTRVESRIEETVEE